MWSQECTQKQEQKDFKEKFFSLKLISKGIKIKTNFSLPYLIYKNKSLHKSV